MEHANDNFPANYEQLNWIIKRCILCPVRLLAWEYMNAPCLIPPEADARKIGLAHNWQDYLDSESVAIIAGKAKGRGDFVMVGSHA